MKALITTDGEFFWNLTANVGRNSPNHPDDVELIRYAFFCMPMSSRGAGSKMDAAIRASQVYGPYGPDLQKCIDVFQQYYGKITDGHISPVPAVFSLNRDTINRSLANLHYYLWERDLFRWPRIDQALESGPALTFVVAKVFGQIPGGQLT